MTINEIDALMRLIRIDNAIMSSNITLDDVFRSVDYNDIAYENVLIIYNGDIDVTKKILNSNIKNAILYPNHSYLAVNKFLVRNRNDIALSPLPNDFEYQKKQHEFDHILVLNDELLYDSVKGFYDNIEFFNI